MPIKMGPQAKAWKKFSDSDCQKRKTKPISFTLHTLGMNPNTFWVINYKIEDIIFMV